MDIGYHNFIKLSILFLKIRRKNMAKTKFKGNFKEILKELRKKKESYSERIS